MNYNRIIIVIIVMIVIVTNVAGIEEGEQLSPLYTI